MRVLLVGENNGQLATASRMAGSGGARVRMAGSVEEALEILRTGGGADVLMVHVQMDIRNLIQSLVRERFSIPVVACGIGSDARSAVAAIRAGAREYLPLPPEPGMIAAILAAVAEDSTSLVFRDPAMEQTVRLAEQIAGSVASVLITGESGVGKEVMARHMHQLSGRSDRPFVSVNCAAIPDNLLESEMFGHEKGAFTGAVARRMGKFEEANGGTLLLDEISEMDIRLQAKLLRVLQEREIDRIGGSRPVRVDIRVMATSNRDLAAEIARGSFREDLLFRLNVFNLKIPPLRERPVDIRVLAEHFIRRYCGLNDLPPKVLSGEAMAALVACPWRGNVRELENTMHRAVLLASGEQIQPGDLRLPDGDRLEGGVTAGAGSVVISRGDDGAGGAGPGDPAGSLVGRTVADVERELILRTLGRCLGNRTHAANILGISIRTLRNKLKLYGDDGARVPAPGEAPLRRDGT